MADFVKEIIVSPHYDDAVFSLFHLLIKNKDIEVITVFSAKPADRTYKAWDLLCSFSSSYATMLKRKAENIAVFKKLNQVNTVDLDFLEHQYQKTSPDRSKLIEESIIKRIPSKQSKIYFPIALGDFVSHPDHVELREIGLKLSSAGYNVYFYCDFPYINPQKFIKKNHGIDKAKQKLGLDIASQAIYLSPTDYQFKSSIMKLYQSQYLMTNLVSFNRLSRRELLGVEIVNMIKK